MLGLIYATTPGPARALPGTQSLCPFDPGFQTRGEEFVSYDTQLGAAAAVAPAQATPDDFIAALNAHNDKVFMLSLISTVAVTGSALLTLIRTARLMAHDRK